MQSIHDDLQVCASGHAHQLSKYMFSPSRPCFLCFPWWMCQMGGIACMRTMTCMLLNSLTWYQQQCSPCLLHARCWDGSITCTGTVSSICACCGPCYTCSCCNSFSRLWSSCSSLSFCFSKWKSFSVPFSAFTWSSCHVFTSYPHFPKLLSSQVDLLELATLFCLFVFNNLPLAFISSRCAAFCYY